MKEQEVTSKVSLEALGSLLLVEAPHSMSKLASESANPKYSPNQTIEVWRVSYYCSFHALQPPSTHNLCNDCLLLFAFIFGLYSYEVSCAPSSIHDMAVHATFNAFLLWPLQVPSH